MTAAGAPGLLLTATLVALGGAVGAPLRYLVDLAVQSRHDSVFPWGTFVVNAGGSLLLGLVAGAAAQGGPGWLMPLLGVGLCGALTTFSTFGYETVRLIEEGSMPAAAVNVGASLAVCLVAASLGYAVVSLG